MSFFNGFEKLSKEKLKGGLADNIPDKAFDKKQVAQGMKVEREHTKDKASQKEIAQDHLKEDPKYYKKLEKIEKKGFTNGFGKASKTKNGYSDKAPIQDDIDAQNRHYEHRGE